MRRFVPALVLFGLLFALLAERSQQAAAVAGFGPILIPPTAVVTPVLPPISGYSLWLDANGVGNTNHTWLDQSGNAYNAVAVSTGSYVDPVLTPGAVNGLASYSFPGGTNVVQMLTTGYAVQTNMSAFVVFKAGSGGLSSNQSALDANYASGYSMEYQNYGSYGAEYWFAADDYLSGLTADTNPHIQSLNMGQVSGTGMQSYLDGLLLHAQTGGSSVTTNVRYIGYFSYSSATWNGYVSEVLEYPVQLSPANTALTVEYLGNKWGVNVPPISLSPLFWYRSDKGVTSGGGNITQWNDQSGNGYTMTLDTFASAPAYSATGGVNNLPHLTWSASSTNGLHNASISASTAPLDLFVVASTATASAPTNDYLLCDGTAALEVLQLTSSPTLAYAIDPSFLHTLQIPAVPVGVPFIVEASGQTSPNAFIGIGGATPVTGNAGVASTMSGLTIGHYFSSSTSNSWDGDIYEVLGFNSTLTANQRTSVMQYFRARYSPSDPGDLTDLVMWLRADQVVSPTNGAVFSQWKDLVNGGATYTQSVGAYQYTWNASDPLLGGRPSATNDGARQMPTGVTTLTQPFTVYIVANMTTTGSTQVMLVNVSDTFEMGTDGGNYYSYDASGYITGPAQTVGAHVMTFIYNGASSAIYVDSSTTPIVTGSHTTSTYTSAVDVGRAGNYSLVGTTPEYLVFQGAHTPTQIARVYSYLAGRYGQAWN